MNRNAQEPSRIVVVPTYDEAENIVRLLDQARVVMPGLDVLVVDDSSPDGTAALVEERMAEDPRVHLLVRDTKEGLGAAYRAGFAWALARGYDEIAQMDADLSHPTDRLPALFEALERADIAVGSRYVAGGGVARWPLSRQVISRGGNLYVRLVLNVPVHDCTAGYKAFRRDALVRAGVLRSESDGYCFQVESTWRASRQGLRIQEVPILFTDRTAGTSKMGGAIVAEAMARVLRWRWSELTGVTGRVRPHVAR